MIGLGPIPFGAPEREEPNKNLRAIIYDLPFTPHARVVKWQTRTFEGRMPQGMGVQVPPRAPLILPRPAFAGDFHLENEAVASAIAVTA